MTSDELNELLDSSIFISQDIDTKKDDERDVSSLWNLIRCQLKAKKNLKNLKIIETIRGEDRESMLKNTTMGFILFFQNVAMPDLYGFPSYAAYLLPSDLKEGQNIVLQDLIENITESREEENSDYRLKSVVAMWDGEKFIVDMEGSALCTILG